jgi:4-hydroxy-2-oxoglutarate aldolase
MQNDLAKARKMQQKVIPLNTAVTASWGVPALKAAMDHLGIYGGPVRRPLLPLKEDISEKLVKLLTEVVSEI